MPCLDKGFPRQDVPVCEFSLVGQPRPDFNLKCRVITMHPEEIVDCRLRMRDGLPVPIDIDVIHEVQGPEKVVDVLMFWVRATKPGDFVVKLAIHFCGFRSEFLVWFLKQLSSLQ